MEDLDFRVGDVVTSVLHGVGVIANYYKGRDYPVEVRFKNGEYQIFTRDGRFNLLYYKRILYHGEIYDDPYAVLEVKPVRIESTKSYKQRTLDKWFWFMLNPGKGSEDYIAATGRLDELEILNNCWACELVKRRENFFVPECSKCPIKGFRDNRCIGGSLFWQWRSNRTSKNARKIYDTILTTWEE